MPEKKSECTLWTDKPSILLDEWHDFFPFGEKCFEQQMNAFVRFGAYLGGLLSIVRGAQLYLLIIPLVMLVSYVVIKAIRHVEGFDSGSGEHTTPTEENPFMNLLVSEMRGAKAPALSSTIPNVFGGAGTTLDHMFKDRAWADPEDTFNHTQSQRAYVTQPSTTNPNDQEAYINYAYSGMMRPTCKEEGVLGSGAMCGLDRAAQGLVRG